MRERASPNAPRQTTRWQWIAAAATGVLFNYVLGVEPWSPAIWLAPIPLLVASRMASSLSEVSRLAVFAGLLGLASTIGYCVRSGFQGLETVAVIGTFALPQAIPLIATVIVWHVASRGRVRWHAAFVFPIVAAAVDFAFASIWPHGTWASWANSQMDVLPVIQLAALGGTPAVVFVSALPAAVAVVIIADGGNIEKPVVAYALPVFIVIAAGAYGATRLLSAPVTARVSVGLAASDATDFLPPNPGSQSDPTLATYLDAATRLAAAGAEIVVLPEKIEIMDEAAATIVRARLSAWAREQHTNLVVGVAIVAADYRDNRAWLFHDDGELRVDYAKRHLIPFSEGRFRAGRRDAIVKLDGRVLGVTICKDMDFPRLSRRYGREGVQAVLTPAWNLGTDGRYHSRMAVLRGVEQGFSVIRAARQGRLTVSDAFGRIVAEAASADSPVTMLSVHAPLGGFRTPYSRFGDAFSWGCTAIVALLVCWPRR